jgi:hypothetical protein
MGKRAFARYGLKLPQTSAPIALTTVYAGSHPNKVHVLSMIYDPVEIRIVQDIAT